MSRCVPSYVRRYVGNAKGEQMRINPARDGVQNETDVLVNVLIG